MFSMGLNPPFFKHAEPILGTYPFIFSTLSLVTVLPLLVLRVFKQNLQSRRVCGELGFNVIAVPQLTLFR